MNFRRIVLSFLILLLSIAFLVSCGNKENKEIGNELTPIATDKPSITEPASDSSTPTPAIDVTAVPDPGSVTENADNHENEVISRLTGLYIPAEYADQRPYAVMINNIIHAYPQSGLSDADILYEALVEYGITRFLAIYDASKSLSANTERIGSVRSARHYFVSFSNQYDAIFVHFGETSYAANQIKKQNVDDIEGMNGGALGSAFIRDKSIEAPHNVFFSLSELQALVADTSRRTTIAKDNDPGYVFNSTDTIPEAADALSANKVTIGFSYTATPYFVYDKTSASYTRYAFDELHVDANTGEPLTFKNLLIQFVKEWDKDDNGYQTMSLADASGTGYYVSDGKAISITWEKKESTQFMRYYDGEGNELSMNPGKTYIAVVPTYQAPKVIME